MVCSLVFGSNVTHSLSLSLSVSLTLSLCLSVFLSLSLSLWFFSVPCSPYLPLFSFSFLSPSLSPLLLAFFSLSVPLLLVCFQFKESVAQLHSVASGFSSLAASLFDADPWTLEYMNLYPNDAHATMATHCTQITIKSIHIVRIGSFFDLCHQPPAVLYPPVDHHFFTVFSHQAIAEVNTRKTKRNKRLLCVLVAMVMSHTHTARCLQPLPSSR